MIVDSNGNGSVGFTLTKPVPTIYADKQDSAGSSVVVTAAITAVFPTGIYVETRDRAQGIRVDQASSGFVSTDTGRDVNVEGTLEKDSSTKEVYISVPAPGTNSTGEAITPLTTSDVPGLTCGCGSTYGQGWYFPGVFYQATLNNTTSVSEANWYNPTPSGGGFGGYDPDNLWAPDSVSLDGTAATTLHGFSSNGSWQEHCPDIVTTITGLDSSGTYEVYVVQNEGWIGGSEIASGLSDSNLTVFSGLVTGAVVDEPSQDVGVRGAVVSSPLGTASGPSVGCT